jgi:hypothetical protein
LRCSIANRLSAGRRDKLPPTRFFNGSRSSSEFIARKLDAHGGRANRHFTAGPIYRVRSSFHGSLLSPASPSRCPSHNDFLRQAIRFDFATVLASSPVRELESPLSHPYGMTPLATPTLVAHAKHGVFLVQGPLSSSLASALRLTSKAFFTRTPLEGSRSAVPVR